VVQVKLLGLGCVVVKLFGVLLAADAAWWPLCAKVVSAGQASLTEFSSQHLRNIGLCCCSYTDTVCVRAAGLQLGFAAQATGWLGSIVQLVWHATAEK
jgi:hypothetical protein